MTCSMSVSLLVASKFSVRLLALLIAMQKIRMLAISTAQILLG